MVLGTRQLAAGLLQKDAGKKNDDHSSLHVLMALFGACSPAAKEKATTAIGWHYNDTPIVAI